MMGASWRSNVDDSKDKGCLREFKAVQECTGCRALYSGSAVLPSNDIMI